MYRFIIILTLAGMFFSGVANATQVDPIIWVEKLSWEEMAAMFKKKAAARKVSDQATKQGNGKKRRPKLGSAISEVFYLFSGSFPSTKRKDNFLQNTHLWLEDPDGSVKGLTSVPRSYMIMASNKNGGWYQLSAYKDYGVQDGVRHHLFSQDSFLNHSDPVRRRETEQIERAGFYKGRPIMEIVHIVDDLSMRYMIHSGDELRVRVLLNRQPVKCVQLTLVTENSWQKKIETDENGEGRFTLIKETFQQGKVDRNRFEKYLLIAEYRVNERGQLNGKTYERERYVATLPLRVYPCPLDWESKNTGYIIAMFTIGIVSGAAVISRKRRRRDEGG